MRSKYLAIIVLGAVLASCQKRVVRPIAPPPPTIVTVAVPVAAPAPVSMDIPHSLPVSAGASLFEEAESAFALGDYLGAIQDYENFLQSFPNDDRIDQVLFHLGVAYVLRTQPPPDW